MEEKTYVCVECGKEWKRSELKIRDGIYASCLGCGYNFIIEAPEIKVAKKSKKER